MLQLDIIIHKFYDPMDLSAGQLLRVSKISEIVVVSPHNHHKLRSINVATPFAKRANNSHEFPVIHLIVSFSRGHQLRVIGDRVPISIRIFLEKDGASNEE